MYKSEATVFLATLLWNKNIAGPGGTMVSSC